MNEEIDIIELLQRVKEGKAPKGIKIEGTKYKFQENCSDIVWIYQTEDYDDWLENEDITLDTKIKILDKPIIEELKTSEGHTELSGFPYTIYPSKDEIIDKINEIAKHINKEEK